jgi:predicted glycosyltransferase
MGEMEPALESLRARGNGHRTVLGWRDILDAPDRVREEWRARDTLALIERLHDEIWVYGDPAVFDVRESYAIPDRVAERIRYLGYLSPPRDPSRRESFRGGLNLDGAPLAIVTAGGGEDGERLLQCYREAASRGLLPDGMRSLLVTGPFMSPEVVQSLAADTPPGVTVTTFLPGLDAAIAAADVVVGLAGYNTVCEVLGAGTPAVLVPRRGHREEQRIRAERLSALHVVEHLPLEGLAPNALADAVARALERGPLPAPTLPLDGLAMVRGAIERLLPSASGADAAESSRPLAAAAGSLGETIP